MMTVLFGGLCLSGWGFSHAEAISLSWHRVGHWFSGFSTFSNLLGTLADSAMLVVKKLGTGFMVACLVAAGLGYALFLSLGTVYFRLAFARHQSSHL